MNRNTIVYSQWTFTDSDIHSGNMYLAMALMSDALEANTFTATVECADRSIINFERNTPLTYSYKGQQRGIFYVQSITRDGPTTYTISATSAIGLLIERLHYGGIYTGQTVAEVLPSICGTVPYVVKTNLRDIALYGWLPAASSRDNLSQVLFAVGAYIRTDLDGVLHIEALWDGIINDLGKDRMYQGAAVNYSAKVTQVIVTEHQYVEGTEQVQLFEGTASQNDVITFDEPMHDLAATGFSILESGANYAKVSSGSGTLTGKKYIHNTREVVRDVSQAKEPNVKTVTEATLISLVNSVGVAERLANYYQWTETIESGVIYQGELPGNRANTWNPYDSEAVTACLERADITLSNTLKAEETMLVGFVPPKYEQIVTYDERVVLTSAGSWTVPDGVTQVRAVLIGGGDPGENGQAGTSNTTTSQRWYNQQSYATPSSGGKPGGSGGKGGQGGKVFEATMDVAPGQQIAYSAGAGGTAAASATESTFGDLSSGNGSSSSLGYTDIITGETFARAGADGIDGGAGGNYGSQGESVNGVAGGYPQSGSSLLLVGSAISEYFNTSWSGSGGGGASATQRGRIGGYFSVSAAGYTSSGGEFEGATSVDSRGYGGGGDGGPGADGALYGDGGGGGHGGGGAGGFSSVNVSAKSNAKMTQGNFSGTFIPGGSGGDGGAGAPGCIILYFGVQETVPSGPFVDKNNKTFLDKFGRLIVV